jgi:hypothetical protein
MATSSQSLNRLMPWRIWFSTEVCHGWKSDALPAILAAHFRGKRQVSWGDRALVSGLLDTDLQEHPDTRYPRAKEKRIHRQGCHKARLVSSTLFFDIANSRKKQQPSNQHDAETPAGENALPATFGPPSTEIAGFLHGSCWKICRLIAVAATNVLRY